MEINVIRVKILMAEQGMTQNQLSEKSGVTRQSISAILSKGKCKPETVRKIAFGLGVTVQELAKEGR